MAFALPHVGSLCVGIIFISYALQVKYKPFLDPNLDAAEDVKGSGFGVEVVYVSGSHHSRDTAGTQHRRSYPRPHAMLCSALLCFV